MKYANKSSAVRAAKKQFGGEWETKAAVQADEEGGFVLIERQPDNEQGRGAMTQDEAEPIDSGLGFEETEGKQNFSLAEALAESGETLDELKDDAAPASPEKASKGWRLSTTEKPTKKVWAIADSMPGASRKDVIAACEAAGIGAGTSRTQYQAWFTAMKASGLNPRG